MIPTTPLALGKFSSSDLVVSISESTRKISPEIENQVDAIWEEKKKKADEEGRVCFNGTSYRINSLKEENGEIAIDFGLLEYKARQALQTIPAYLELPDDYYHKGSYSGATVKTSDGKFLVVELSGKSMNMNTIDMLGGIMEKPSEIVTGEDVFDCVYSELEEEACIERNDIKECYLRSVFLTSNTHTCFYYEVTLNLSAVELLDRFSGKNKDQDIRSLKALSREEYISFLKTNTSPAKQHISGIINI